MFQHQEVQRVIENPGKKSSLIICSRNRAQMLEDSVMSILAGSRVPTELIIVDQSDTANPFLATLTTERACDIRYFWTEDVGLSRANNVGIAQSRYELLVFTHDDVLVTPDWFANLTDSLDRLGPKSVVTGQVLPSHSEAFDGFQLTLKVDDVPATYTGRIHEDVLYPLNMAMHRSTIEEIGAFDEMLGPGTPFPSAEDNDLGFRLLEAGYLIYYEPQATLYHRAWRPKDDYLRLRWDYGIGQGAFYAKHLDLRDRYMLWRMVKHAGLRVVNFPYRMLYSRPKAYGDIVFALGMIYGTVKWLLTRTKPNLLRTQ
jgi:GT2 family glycosyltransferase